MLRLLSLGYPDSNQERQDQNLQCYHYTIAQSFCECKGSAICVKSKIIDNFFSYFFVLFLKKLKKRIFYRFEEVLFEKTIYLCMLI